MKKFISAIALITVLVLILASCTPVGPAPPTPADIPSGGEVPGTVTLVKSIWSGGDLDFTKTDGTVILGLDGTNGDVEITEATITAGTATTLTVTTLTAPTVSGTTDIDDLTADNVTITGGSISGATISVASPTITGTSVVSNRASGQASFVSATTSLNIAHGITGTPTRVFLGFRGVPGIAADANGYNLIYVSAINSTNITLTAMVSTNATISIDWLALLADE